MGGVGYSTEQTVARPAPTLLPALSLLLSLPSLAQVGPTSIPVPLEPPEVGVPFGCGMSFPVSQVHNVGSHVGNDSWAWDFRMPEGTPVVAALDGVVRLARGDSTEGGCDPAMARKANYVVIESDGGLETQYLHFSSVSVEAGQHVRRGDLLGYSGKTGWACGAHLHFKVATPTSAGWNNPSVEARLAGFGDPALESWVSSPPCAAPLQVAGQQPMPAPRAVPAVEAPAGEVRPAALSASAGPPELDAHAPANLEQHAAAAGLATGAAPDRVGPLRVEHPLSAGGSPLTHSPLPAPSAPLGPGRPASAPAAVARPPLGMQSVPLAPHDSERESVDAAPSQRR